MDNNNVWTEEHTILLTKLYNDDKLELLEICKIMKKKCKVIIAKLLELGIVKSKNDVRGTNLEYVKPKLLNTSSTTNSTTESTTNPEWSVIKVLNNVNNVIGEISKVCATYSNFVNQLNQLNKLANETPSTNKTSDP